MIDSNQPQTSYSQPRLFQTGKDSTRIVELFPEIWSAAEDLTNPNSLIRQSAIGILDNTGAARISPLLACLIASSITDPDMLVRMNAIRIIGDVLATDEHGEMPPEAVLLHLYHNLEHIRTRQVYSMVQALASFPELAPQVIRIFLASRYAGNHLIEIVNSRKVPVEIRQQSIWLIGEVGYLDAIPSLERLLVRMESRLNGQQSMPFAPPVGIDDSDLLPGIKITLALLNSP